jgi:hypothetical protein
VELIPACWICWVTPLVEIDDGLGLGLDSQSTDLSAFCIATAAF